jgi:hypothetical protein
MTTIPKNPQSAVPLWHGDDIEKLLTAIYYEFNFAKQWEVLDYESTAGPECCFNNFRQCLKGSAQDQCWEVYIPAHGEVCDLAAFDASLLRWKQQDMSETQKFYIETVTKPYTMEVREFA